MRFFYRESPFDEVSEPLPGETARLTLIFTDKGRFAMRTSATDFATIEMLLRMARGALLGNESYEPPNQNCSNGLETQLGGSKESQGREV